MEIIKANINKNDDGFIYEIYAKVYMTERQQIQRLNDDLGADIEHILCRKVAKKIGITEDLFYDLFNTESIWFDGDSENDDNKILEVTFKIRK
jgi:hypothetical protein